MRENIEKNPSCVDDYDRESITTEEAINIILSSISPIKKTELVPIRESLNRVLAIDVKSTINVPSAKNSAMDGYAINSKNIPKKTKTLKVVGKSLAGKPCNTSIKDGQCVKIMTGAVVPDGADTVVIQEHVETSKTQNEILIDNEIKPGSNVREAGEDIAKGAIAIKKGKNLTPADIGLLASLGIPKVEVYRKLKIAFFSTGDELRSLGEKLNVGDVYDSNRYTLYTMLSNLNVEIFDMGVVKDDKESLTQAFNEAAGEVDMLITSGGVSVGEADYIKDILEKYGNINFWKVAIKPGRPLTFGKIKSTLFFGLPGNPVSVMVTFYQFTQLAIKKFAGETSYLPIVLKAISTSSLRKKPGRVEYQRGIFEKDKNNNLTVRKTGPQGSGILRSMSEANCFIVLPIDSKEVNPGDSVDIQPFEGII
ncbi:MAG: molybdopterin molybdenumtransferase MoeA [Legionellales bacterium]|mgnify:FL=1|nr:molybdopterin molybdenumtransferase MoeA [Legionellales bacterium]|tara:strand:+ start:2648 stop:3916 length:1269 start_codon:yes stop_codon:yes gene_type:complete